MIHAFRIASNIMEEFSMDTIKHKAIEQIIDSSIKTFAEGFRVKHTLQIDDPNGIINAKKNNCFIAELGQEFMFYSAFVRSFDSSFGKVLESIGNAIAKLSYEVRGKLSAYLLPQQSQHMDYMISEYEKNIKPSVDDYNNFTCMMPKDIRSFNKTHVTDHYFYNKEKNEHYLIELKAGGDLDNKKAKSEKLALLQEYFILKNYLNEEVKKDGKIYIFLGTAYNMFGEGSYWKQDRVRQFFANEELLIGKDYWNFVCDDSTGFEIIMNQHKKSAQYIKTALDEIKTLYFGNRG
ncbi:MjaII restriction endonuclease [Treponema phagedenis F0421]|nr:MjaII restriction endonuclease [Treponema phagedenis F0421]